MDQNKNYCNNPNLPRLKDFDKVPSPYLVGIFDDLIKENPKERWLASWETNRGCPFSCTYCDWGLQLIVKFQGCIWIEYLLN